MANPSRLLTLGVLASAAVLLAAGNCQAQFRGFRPLRARAPYFPPNRMPGWDNYYINPYSPYNYGRNPYNPIRVPYVAPYPVYNPMYSPYGMPYSVPYAVPTDPGLQGPALGSSVSYYPGDLIPTPTGPLTAPPPGSAAIELRVPDRFAQVWFDGENTYSMGTTRYYVTPELRQGKEFPYLVKVQWNRNGRPVTEERKIMVRAGQTARIDFTRPDRTE
jgi:uncharacterized protein (TIGR03000 family)